MEYVVIFNIGMEAAQNGAPRVAPKSIEYPIRTRWENRNERVDLDEHNDRFILEQWFKGYDAWMERIAA